jgi:hypothetical protein
MSIRILKLRVSIKDFDAFSLVSLLLNRAGGGSKAMQHKISSQNSGMNLYWVGRI